MIPTAAHFGPESYERGTSREWLVTRRGGLWPWSRQPQISRRGPSPRISVSTGVSDRSDSQILLSGRKNQCREDQLYVSGDEKH
jgi:hypothetical protein